MANARNFAKFVQDNYDLLADNSNENQVELTEEVSPEEIEQVNQIIMENEAEEDAESMDSSDEFEDNPKTVRHASCPNEKVDYYSKKKDKDATQMQTKWAVKVFRGNFYNI